MLIVGGAGAMGTWFRGFLELAGHMVHVADPSLGSLPEPRPHGRFARLDEIGDLDRYAAIWVAVPLNRTAAVLEELITLRPKGAIVEVASIKAPLLGALARARDEGVKVFALHPMFGPGKSFYESLTFVLAAQGDLAEDKRLLAPLLTHPYTHLVAVPFVGGVNANAAEPTGGHCGQGESGPARRRPTQGRCPTAVTRVRLFCDDPLSPSAP